MPGNGGGTNGVQPGVRADEVVGNPVRQASGEGERHRAARATTKEAQAGQYPQAPRWMGGRPTQRTETP